MIARISGRHWRPFTMGLSLIYNHSWPCETCQAINEKELKWVVNVRSSKIRAAAKCGLKIKMWEKKQEKKTLDNLAGMCLLLGYTKRNVNAGSVHWNPFGVCGISRSKGKDSCRL